MLNILHFLFSFIFIVLIIVSLYFSVLAKISNKVVEGMEDKKLKYKSYQKDPIQMATKNEENINFLRQEVDKLKLLSEKAEKLKEAVDNNSKNVDALVKKEEAQAQAATSAAAAISG